MDCGKAQRLVQDLADGRLAEGVSREVQRHVADCSDCRVIHQRSARLQQLLAVKRYEKPGQEYFEGFLGEFHRRLEGATAPQPTLWERVFGVFHIQSAPTLRYGFAHAFGVVLAFGMILRGMISGDFGREVTRADALSFGTAQMQAASALPAPYSTPPRIAGLLPTAADPAAGVGGALILPVESSDESSSPRYVLDRISRAPSTYEVASIHF